MVTEHDIVNNKQTGGQWSVDVGDKVQRDCESLHIDHMQRAVDYWDRGNASSLHCVILDNTQHTRQYTAQHALDRCASAAAAAASSGAEQTQWRIPRANLAMRCPTSDLSVGPEFAWADGHWAIYRPSTYLLLNQRLLHIITKSIVSRRVFRSHIGQKCVGGRDCARTMLRKLTALP